MNQKNEERQITQNTRETIERYLKIEDKVNKSHLFKHVTKNYDEHIPLK